MNISQMLQKSTSSQFSAQGIKLEIHKEKIITENNLLENFGDDKVQIENYIKQYMTQKLTDEYTLQNINELLLVLGWVETLDSGVKVMENALMHCNQLKRIYLGLPENGITEIGLQSLMTGITAHRNSVIKLQLYFHGNDIGDVGIKIIADTIKQIGSQLLSLSLGLSNCQVQGQKISQLSHAISSKKNLKYLYIYLKENVKITQIQKDQFKKDLSKLSPKDGKYIYFDIIE